MPYKSMEAESHVFKTSFGKDGFEGKPTGECTRIRFGTLNIVTIRNKVEEMMKRRKIN